MALLQLEVSDRLVSKIGMQTLYLKMRQLLELQEIQLIAIEINEQIKIDGLDQDMMFREAKRKAWQQFKSEKLQGILP